jgi:hypothetical protein
LRFRAVVFVAVLFMAGNVYPSCSECHYRFGNPSICGSDCSVTAFCKPTPDGPIANCATYEVSPKIQDCLAQANDSGSYCGPENPVSPPNPWDPSNQQWVTLPRQNHELTAAIDPLAAIGGGPTQSSERR